MFILDKLDICDTLRRNKYVLEITEQETNTENNMIPL